MPEFHAVRCCSCKTFQVQQVKKINKWSCSVCGQKQTVLQVYAISSSAKDVRGVVIRLNMARGEAEVLAAEQAFQQGQKQEATGSHTTAAAVPSRPAPEWSTYEDEPEEPPSDDVWGCDQDPGFTTVMPNKCKAGQKRKATSDVKPNHGQRDSYERDGPGQETYNRGRSYRNETHKPFGVSNNARPIVAHSQPIVQGNGQHVFTAGRQATGSHLLTKPAVPQYDWSKGPNTQKCAPIVPQSLPSLQQWTSQPAPRVPAPTAKLPTKPRVNVKQHVQVSNSAWGDYVDDQECLPQLNDGEDDGFVTAL